MELIDLKNLSSAAIALQIWESPNIKNQVRNLFLIRQRDKIKVRQYKAKLGSRYIITQHAHDKVKEQYINFQSITNSAILNLDLLELPVEHKNSCKIAVRELGERIYEWCEYVTETLDFDFKFAEKIFWRTDGTIDEDKIFTTWEKDPEFLNYKTMIGPASHILACVNVNEDFMDRNQAEMEKHLKTHRPLLDLSNCSNKIYKIVALYLYLHIKNKGYNTNNTNTRHIIPPNEIFLLCARSGYTKAALYFWKFIPNPSLPVFINDCLNETFSYFKSKYQKEKSIEVIVFLINQMTIEQKISFLQEGKNVVKIFCRILLAKPDHEIISELIENYLSGLSVFDHQQILQNILELLEEYLPESTKHKKKYFCAVFYKILTKLPEDLKREIFDVSFFKMPPFKISDVNILKLILSCIDPNLRFEILKEILHGVMSLLENNDMEKFDKFMHHILISDDERNFFKKNLLDQFVMDCNFKIVNELFDYFSMPPEEIKRFKEGVDYGSTFQSFLRGWRYDKAEKFLEWMYPDEEERENYRYSLAKNTFIYERTFENSYYLNNFLDFGGNPKDFYKYFFGFPDEEKSVKNPEIYLRFREKLIYMEEEDDNKLSYGDHGSNILLMNKFSSGETFLRKFYDFYDESELINLYMKWISHDKNRREAIKIKYGHDVEDEFFKKLMFLLFGQPNSPRTWECPAFPLALFNK